MTETPFIRLDAQMKNRLDGLAKQSRGLKPFLAEEAITAYVEAEEWQLGEIRTGLKELDAGARTDHREVAKWLRCWGTESETNIPK